MLWHSRHSQEVTEREPAVFGGNPSPVSSVSWGEVTPFSSGALPSTWTLVSLSKAFLRLQTSALASDSPRSFYFLPKCWNEKDPQSFSNTRSSVWTEEDTQVQGSWDWSWATEDGVLSILGLDPWVLNCKPRCSPAFCTSCRVSARLLQCFL